MPSNAAAVAGSAIPEAAFICWSSAKSDNCCCCCFKLEEVGVEELVRTDAGELDRTGFGRVNSRFACFSSECLRSDLEGGSVFERGSTNFSAVFNSFSALSKMSFCFESLVFKSTEGLRVSGVVLTSPPSLETSLFFGVSSNC